MQKKSYTNRNSNSTSNGNSNSNSNSDMNNVNSNSSNSQNPTESQQHPQLPSRSPLCSCSTHRFANADRWPFRDLGFRGLRASGLRVQSIEFKGSCRKWGLLKSVCSRFPRAEDLGFWVFNSEVHPMVHV